MKISVIVAVSVIFSMLSANLAISNEEAGVTDIGIPFKPNDAVLTKTKTQTKIVNSDTGFVARYYRLHIRVENPDAAPWSMILRSQTGQVLSTFDQSETACASPSGCWSRRLDGASVQVEFSTAASDARAIVDDALFMPTNAQKPYYSPIPGKKIQFLSSLGTQNPDRTRAIQKVADRLGMFMATGTRSQDIRVNWCCSGIRLTKDLFMTNWHCGAPEGVDDQSYWKAGQTSEACQSGIVDLSWDGDAVSREYSCTGVEYVSRQLDTAIIRLGQIADGDALSSPADSLVIAQTSAAAGQQLIVLQHDACSPKSLSQSCGVKNPNADSWLPQGSAPVSTEFTYNCPTEAGSSGGPVLDDETKGLVGLHHLGHVDDPTKGNSGVKIEAILGAIKASNAALFLEITAK